MLALSLCHCSQLTDTTIIITITASPTQQFTILCTTATVFLELHTQFVNRLLESQLTDWPLYFAFLYLNTFSLTSFLEMEDSCFCLLEKTAATVCICAFSYVYFHHAYCCWYRFSMYLLVCVCVVHLSHTHTDVIVGYL